MRKKLTLLFLFVSLLTFSQFCDDFNNQNVSNWLGVEAEPNFADNPGPSGATNDFFLHATDDQGYSYIYNQVDYQGNWQEYNGQCLCWDFQVINDGNLGEPLSPRLIIYSGSSTSPTASAAFTATVQTSEGDGWVHICAPINVLNDGDAFPSNANGSWNMAAGSTATDWNNLLQNITGIRFVLDLTSSPTEEYGYDNICIQDCDIVGEPTDEGAFCCDGENLVENGNFEFGNTGFISDYVNDGSLYPGAYDVSSSSSLFGTDINDHSYCEDSNTYTNSQFLLVNGKTTQPAGTTSVIWEQTLTVNPESNYKFCANFKNLPQCRFDILPEIQVEINGNLYPWQIINTSNDPCDWQNIEECFTSDSEQVTVKIHLNEEGLGDGNDLAIDDIALQEKLSQNLAITVQHQGTDNEVTGSVNTLSTADDMLLVNDLCVEENDGNQYYWFVFELDSYPFTGLFDNMVPGTFAWSSNQTGFSQQTGGTLSSTWNLTTNFPDYVFEDNKLYMVGMYVPTCCDSCYDEAWAYQLTLNVASAKGASTSGLSNKMKEEIKSMFIAFNGDDIKEDESDDKQLIDPAFKAYPNPSTDVLYVSSTLVKYEVKDLSGKTVLASKGSVNAIDITKLKSGIYFLVGKTEKSEEKTIKFIKE